jgi:DNA-binding transcriptional ArsR family regulator
MDKFQPDLDRLFGALADGTRRAIVIRLCKGAATVSELAKPFDMALPSLMKHLRVLETSGVIETAKHGRTRTCSLRAEALEGVEEWAAAQRAVWSQRFDRLEAYVEKMKH